MFKNLFGRKPLRRFPDSFTLTQSRKLSTLCEWVGGQMRSGNFVIVLSHFQSTFLVTQDALQDAGFEYEVLSHTIASDKLLDQFKSQSTRILITMAQMLDPETAVSSQLIPATELSAIVMERYPLIKNDERLESYLQHTGSRVSMGYLVSFDDPVLRHLMGDRFVELMKHLGLGDNDLVSSAMTHRGFARRLRATTSSISQEKPANSPEEWIQRNLQ